MQLMERQRNPSRKGSHLARAYIAPSQNLKTLGGVNTIRDENIGVLPARESGRPTKAKADAHSRVDRCQTAGQRPLAHSRQSLEFLSPARRDSRKYEQQSRR